MPVRTLVASIALAFAPTIHAEVAAYFFEGTIAQLREETCLLQGEYDCSVWDIDSVRESDRYPGHTFRKGDPFRVLFAWDTESPLTVELDDGAEGLYQSAVVLGELDTAGLSLPSPAVVAGTGPWDQDLSVVNDRFGQSDRLKLRQHFLTSDWYINLQAALGDTSGTVFDGIEIPTTIDLVDFNQPFAYLLLSEAVTNGSSGARLVVQAFIETVSAVSIADTDSDGIYDSFDNCIEVANGPELTDVGGNTQLDTDGDGFGNFCDGDFNNDGTVNFADLAALRSAFGRANSNVDMDGNGIVNFGDLAAFKSGFGKPPGPSGVGPIPADVSLSALPQNLGTGQEAVLAAIVTDAGGNPVGDKIVDFSIIQDSSAGFLSADFASTDSEGRASVSYTAGETPSDQFGVQVRAQVRGTSIGQIETLTVGDEVLFLSLGTGNDIFEPNSALFLKEWAVGVTNAEGNPVAGVEVQVSVKSIRWFQGCYVVGQSAWVRIVTATCNDEDVNGNGVLDAIPVAEDTNANGRIEAGNVALVAARGGGAGQATHATTDSVGFALVNVIYPQSYHGWVEAEIEARVTSVSGRETRRAARFVLDAKASDILNLTAVPPGVFSPFGRQFDATEPFCTTAPEDLQPPCPFVPLID